MHRIVRPGGKLILIETLGTGESTPRVIPFFRSVYDFNTTKRGRLLPVNTVGEALENVPAKQFKEADLWVKTKTPVLILRTDNRIPTD